jgi:hypothetical protein
MTAATWPNVVATTVGSLGGIGDDHDTVAWRGVPPEQPSTAESLLTVRIYRRGSNVS